VNKIVNILIFSATLSGCVTTNDVATKKNDIIKNVDSWAQTCLNKISSELPEMNSEDAKFYEIQVMNVALSVEKLSALKHRDCSGSYEGLSLPSCIKEAEQGLRWLTSTQCPGSDQVKSKMVARQELEKQRQAANDKLIADFEEEIKKARKAPGMGCNTLTNIVIKQKMSPNTYEIATPCFGRDLKSGTCILFEGLMYRSMEQAVLKTTVTKITNAGSLGRIIVRNAGHRKVKLDNGFEATVPVFEEAPDCKKTAH